MMGFLDDGILVSGLSVAETIGSVRVPNKRLIKGWRLSEDRGLIPFFGVIEEQLLEEKSLVRDTITKINSEVDEYGRKSKQV